MYVRVVSRKSSEKFLGFKDANLSLTNSHSTSKSYLSKFLNKLKSSGIVVEILVTAASAIVTDATTLIPAATLTAAPSAARRRKRVGRIIANMDEDEDVTLKDVADIAKDVAVDVEIEESADDDEIKPVELQEVVEVVTIAKLLIAVVTAASAIVTDATTLIPAATLTAAPRNGFSGVDTPLFEGMIVAQQDDDVTDEDEDVTLKDVADIAKDVAVDVEIEESADVQGRQENFQA
nr:hypothetical protein [Tanacetum cinerariifolium]